MRRTEADLRRRACRRSPLRRQQRSCPAAPHAGSPRGSSHTVKKEMTLPLNGRLIHVLGGQPGHPFSSRARSRCGFSRRNPQKGWSRPARAATSTSLARAPVSLSPAGKTKIGRPVPSRRSGTTQSGTNGVTPATGPLSRPARSSAMSLALFVGSWVPRTERAAAGRCRAARGAALPPMRPSGNCHPARRRRHRSSCPRHPSVSARSSGPTRSTSCAYAATKHLRQSAASATWMFRTGDLVAGAHTNERGIRRGRRPNMTMLRVLPMAVRRPGGDRHATLRPDVHCAGQRRIIG